MCTEYNINRFSNSSQSEIWGKLLDNYCLIYPSVLKDFLNSQGISFDSIKRKLADEGKIERDSKGKYSILYREGDDVKRVVKILIIEWIILVRL